MREWREIENQAGIILWGDWMIGSLILILIFVSNSTIQNSLSTLLLVLMGDFDYEGLSQADKVWAPIVSPIFHFVSFHFLHCH